MQVRYCFSFCFLALVLATSAAAQWVEYLPPSERIGAFYADGPVGIVAINNTLTATGDDGQTWTEPVRIGRGSTTFTGFTRIGETYFTATHNGGDVFRTTDPTSDWEEANAGLPVQRSGHPPSIVRLIAIDDLLFIAVDNNGLYRSADLGDSWELANERYDGVYVNVNGKLGIGRRDGLWLTSDLGATFTLQESNWPGLEVIALASDGNRIVALAGDPFTEKSILLTEDEGQSWTDLSQGRDLTEAVSIAIHEGRLYVAEVPHRVSTIDLTNSASGWRQVEFDAIRDLGSPFPPREVRPNAVFTADGRLYVAGEAFSSEIWYADVTEIQFVGTSVDDYRQHEVAHKVYPNPFANAATVEVVLARPGVTRVEVFDAVGRRVATLVEGLLPAGVHRIPFDASSMPSGVYVYRVHTGHQQMSGTLVRLR